MNTVKRIILLLIVLIGGNQAVHAHAVWLESHPIGTKNGSHVVRVYYGEYATGELEPTKDWYSDVEELKLQLLNPKQELETLELVDKGDFFEATFVPSENGTYHLFTSHAAKELGGDIRYEFVSQNSVQVGKEAAVSPIPNLDYQFSIKSTVHPLKKTVEIGLTQGGKPAVEKDILLMSAAGWSKTYKTDKDGKVNVETLWPGTYVLEFSHMSPSSGVWHDKPYSNNWQGLTTSFMVK